MAIYVANNGQLQTVKGIYYAMTEDYINATLFHNLVPKTATEIKFLYASNNPDLTNYQRIGYCDNNNFIEVWNNNTKYIIINPRKNYIYAPVNCSSFLYGYTSLITCIFDNFDTRNTTYMHYMFSHCSNLTSLDLSSFNTSNVIHMFGMFSYCVKLEYLNVDTFDTSKVRNIDEMFLRLSALRRLNLSNFNTSNITTMFSLFANCKNLTEIDLSNFDTSNVTNIHGMFANCENLTSVNLSNFNTAKVSEMWQMFYGCNKLETIYSPSFILKSGVSSTYMFYNCTALVGGNGTTYSSSHIDAEYARVDGENDLPGYFTAPNN